ncbi:hypothetical protein Tco_0617849 [Tanacetum coccineum]
MPLDFRLAGGYFLDNDASKRFYTQFQGVSKTDFDNYGQGKTTCGVVRMFAESRSKKFAINQLANGHEILFHSQNVTYLVSKLIAVIDTKFLKMNQLEESSWKEVQNPEFGFITAHVPSSGGRRFNFQMDNPKFAKETPPHHKNNRYTLKFKDS